MKWDEIFLDLQFDQFGDFELSKGDIVSSNSQIQILKQNTIDRIITANDDYELQRQFGANIPGLMGLQSAKEVESRARSGIIYALTSDGFLNQSNINIFAKKTNAKLLLKVEISVSHVQPEPIALSFIFANNRTFTYAV